MFIDMKVKKMGDGFLDDLGSIAKETARESAKALIPIVADLAKTTAHKKINGTGLYAGRGYDAPIQLTPNQIRALHRGGSIQLKQHMIGVGKHKIILSPETLKKVERAFSKQKGTRLSRDQIEDITQDGGSIFTAVASALAPVVIDKLASFAQSQLGDGLFAGGSLEIQTGSPYQKMSSPAMHPFVDPMPYAGFKPLGKKGKKNVVPVA
jgi:hypothetical protein